MKSLKKGVWQLTDGIGGLAIAFTVLSGITIPTVMWFSKDQLYSNAASHARKVSDAVELYIKDNSDLISASATSTKPYILEFSTLTDYLPAGFSNKNPISQDYKIAILEPAAGKFQAMLATVGGAELSVSAARKIATRIGGKGGYIEGGIAKGSLGAWTQNMAPFGFVPTDGHIAVANFYRANGASTDFLYRKKVDGHPEYNAMNTDLNMNGNNIVSANDVTANKLKAATIESTGNVVAAGTVQGARVESLGDVSANGHITSRGTVKGARVESTGDIAANGVVSARDLIASNAITGGTVRANGMLSGGSFLQLDGVANEGWGCSPNKMLGFSATGEILSCQSGAWRKSSGIGKAHIFRNSGILGNFTYCSLIDVSPTANIANQAACTVFLAKNGVWSLQSRASVCTAACF